MLAKYTDAHGSPELGAIQLYFGKFKGFCLRDVPRLYLERLVRQKPFDDRSEEFQQVLKEFLA